MTNSTVVIKIIRYVIGIGNRVIIRLMARPAIGRRVVVACRVAKHTIESHMSAGKRELGLAMIKMHRQPGGGSMAYRAIMAESVGVMIGIGDRIVVTLVTREAIRGITPIAGSMAGDTIDGQMRAG